jgi:pimeloyl-ACP methyl ester carboxylesterase
MSPQASLVNRHPLCAFVPIAALLLLILIVATLELPATRSSKTRRYSSLIDKIHDTSASRTASDHDRKILQDTLNLHVAGQKNIPYFHCAAKAAHVHSIVLLHGAAFTKEIWTSTGILQQLCSISSSLQVTALDLSVKASAADLKAVLNALHKTKLVLELPVTALVTPSASGGAVADWIAQGYDQQNSQEILQYIETWMPVASFAVSDISVDALQAMKELNWPMFAIYGDLDSAGRRSMKRLGKYAGATVKELHGKHPVYRDSPTEFVLAILDYLNVEF